MEDAAQRWHALQTKVNELRLAEAVRFYRANGLEPLVIKGWSLARFYPPEEPRTASDIDLAIAPEDFDRAVRLKNAPEISKINLDLHCGLRWLDPTPWADIFTRSRLVPLEEEQIRVPANEDLFRIAAVHWLTDSAVRRDRLKDFVYLLVSSEDFDWRLALESTGEVRKSWYMAVLAAARDYENLPSGLLPDCLRDYRLPDWFRSALEREWKRPQIQRGKLLAAWKHPSLFFPLLFRQLTESPVGQCILLEDPITNQAPGFIRIRAFVRKLKRETGLDEKK